MFFSSVRNTLGALILNTSIIQLILVLLLTWHGADLPGTGPAYWVANRQSLPDLASQPNKYSDAKLDLKVARWQLSAGC